jgi:translation initiation factor IF-3
MKQDSTLINDQIKFDTVLVIGADGEQLGTMTAKEANNIADEANLDLVLVSPNAKVPVCKIMDYNKFKFEQAKKAKAAKKNQKEVVVKEIQLSLNIEDHDFNTKVRNARKFLEQENRVNVVLRLRGRENVYGDRAMEVAARFFEACEDIAKLPKPIKREGNNVAFVMFPL